MAYQLPSAARRLGALPPYPFAVLNQRVREMTARGVDVIRLDIGSPDMPPPAPVVVALTASARRADRHGYAGYKGTPAIRAAIARYYRERFGVEVNPETQVLPLIGSKEGIVNLSLAFLDRGDAALVPAIGYPSYEMGAHLAGGDVCRVPLDPTTYLPDLGAVPADVLSRAKLLWINYPNNPTGAVAEPDFYRRCVEFCAAHNLLLASDNPYVDVTFDGYTATSALEAPGALDCTIEFMSFSKTFNMAGWRLGAAVGSAAALATLLQVKSNVDSGHFEAIYDAGVAAVETTPRAWIDARNQVYAARRDRALAILPRIGLRALTPRGSLYLWARADDGDGGAYAEQALAAAGVVLAPGAIYGPDGRDYVLISIAVEDARLDEALRRLESWYAK